MQTVQPHPRPRPAMDDFMRRSADVLTAYEETLPKSTTSIDTTDMVIETTEPVTLMSPLDGSAVS